MARFAVEICTLEVEPHPDADRLEVARVRGYTCVVPKGEFKSGDRAAYIPEMAIVPDDLLEDMDLKGRLAGKKGNRVRALRLRGILSQGLVYANKSIASLEPGTDVTDMLGVKKWEPPIPPEMKGALERYDGEDNLVSYDVEDIKNYPGRLQEGERVTMHEKVHGSLCYFAVEPDGVIRVSSKGRAASQLVFAQKGVDNIYTRMRDRYEDELVELADWFADHGAEGGTVRRQTVHVLCEVYGRKVQDLHYGTELDMVVFDILVDGSYVSQNEIRVATTIDRLGAFNLKAAPLVYERPFSDDMLERHASGESLICGADHMREGVVVRPVIEREDMNGRVMLKSVNPEYLTRKGGTEYD